MREFKESLVSKFTTDCLSSGWPYYTSDDQEDSHNVERDESISNKIDSLPMPIDQLIKTLYDMKGQGANMVSIDYHCDHQEYIVYGSKIEEKPIYLDKAANILPIGNYVICDETEMNYEFTGEVVGFKDETVIVKDSDGMKFYMSQYKIELISCN